MIESDSESYYQFTLLLWNRKCDIPLRNDTKTDRLLFMASAYTACRGGDLTQAEIRRLYDHYYGETVSKELVNKVIRAEIRRFIVSRRKCCVTGMMATSFWPRRVSAQSRRGDPMHSACGIPS